MLTISKLTDVKTFSDLAQKLEGATCTASFWNGRSITLKNSNITIDLLELGTQITACIQKQGCPSTEREALKTVSNKLVLWLQESDQSVKTQNAINQAVDFLSYPVEVLPSFWKPGIPAVQVENLYTEAEWKEQFPGIAMPKPIRVIDKFNLFSDNQIEEAKAEAEFEKI